MMPEVRGTQPILNLLALILACTALAQAPVPAPVGAPGPAPVIVAVGPAGDGTLQPPPPDALAAAIPVPMALDGTGSSSGIVPQTAAGPVAKIHFYASEPGYAPGVEPVYTMLPKNQPWRIRVVSGNMVGQDATNAGAIIPPTRMQVHELKSDPLGTAWVNCTGTAFMRSLVGDPDGWLYIEFRVLVNWADPPGHYVSNALMYFQCAGFTGQIPLELHLNLTETLQVEIDADLEFPDTEGNFTGWMYTTNEGLLTVRSNVDFNLSVSACTDLTGPGAHLYEIETAFRLRQPADTGALWSTWGDIGGDESGHGTPDQWTGAPDGGSPWPGTVSNVSPVNTVGVNEIGLRGAAWRNGVEDLAGDYSGTLTITVSPIP